MSANLSAIFERNGSRTEGNQLEFFTGSEHMIRYKRPIRYKRHDRPLGITKPVRYNCDGGDGR